MIWLDLADSQQYDDATRSIIQPYLSSLFSADTDVDADFTNNAAGPGLQDFATEYDGNMRRVLTVPVVDVIDATGTPPNVDTNSGATEVCEGCGVLLYAGE